MKGVKLDTAKMKLAPGAEVELSIVGNTLYVESATGVFRAESGDNRFPLKEGRLVKLSGKEEAFRFVNDGVSEIEARILYGFGDVEDHAVVGDLSIGAHSKFTALTTVTIAAQAGLIASNANRKKLILQTPATNTGSIWLGGTTEAGIELEPGEGYEIELFGSMALAGTNGDKVYCSELS